MGEIRRLYCISEKIYRLVRSKYILIHHSEQTVSKKHSLFLIPLFYSESADELFFSCQCLWARVCVCVCVCVCACVWREGPLYQRWFKSLALISSHWVSNRSFAPQIAPLFSLTGLSEIVCSNSEKCKASGWQQLPSHTYVLALSPLFPPADSHLLSFTF